MPTSNLKQKTTRGLIWSFIEKFSMYGIQFILGLFIARILEPSHYGLVGMLAIFMAFSAIFIDSGFARALIQKQDRTEADFSTVFYFNLIISLVLYGILFFSAPLIANFYGEPQLVLITRVLSLNFVIQAFNIVQLTKLAIEMDFKTRAIINTFSVLISGVLALVMAYNGCGVWSLIAQTLTKTGITILLLLFIKRWMPKLIFSVSSFRSLFRFGSKLLLASTLSSLMYNLYSFLIGKYFSAKQLGYYTKSLYFTNIIASTASEVLHNVTFPVMSSVQDEQERLTNIYRKLIKFTMFIVAPALLGFALISEPFIRLCLTEKWLPAVPIIRWLCLARLFIPINSLNINLLNAKGYSGLTLKIELIKAPIVITSLIITIPLGLKAIVIGQTIVGVITFIIYAYFPGKIVHYGPMKQLKDMLPTFIATVIMVLAVLPIIRLVPSDFLKIILGIIVGFAVYTLVSILQKRAEVKEIYTLLVNLKNKYFSKK